MEQFEDILAFHYHYHSVCGLQQIRISNGIENLLHFDIQ